MNWKGKATLYPRRLRDRGGLQTVSGGGAEAGGHGPRSTEDGTKRGICEGRFYQCRDPRMPKGASALRTDPGGFPEDRAATERGGGTGRTGTRLYLLRRKHNER